MVIHPNSGFPLIWVSTKPGEDHTTDEKLMDFTSVLNYLDKSYIVSDVCKVHADITIKSTKAEDSQAFKQIQISDLIAGITCHSFKDKNLFGHEDDISKSYKAVLEDRNLIHKICGDEFTPEQLGTNISTGDSMERIMEARSRQKS
jgi:hypothetical protein